MIARIMIFIGHMALDKAMRRPLPVSSHTWASCTKCTTSGVRVRHDFCAFHSTPSTMSSVSVAHCQYQQPLAVNRLQESGVRAPGAGGRVVEEGQG